MIVGGYASGRHAFGAWALALVSCLGVTTHVRPARAAEREPAHLHFIGSPGCDDARALESEVERRLNTVSWTTPDRASTLITVHLASTISHAKSSLFIQQTDRPSVTRVITGGNCDEAIEGTALVIAVLLSHEGSSQQTVTPVATNEQVGIETTQGVDRRLTPRAWRLGGGTSAVLVTGIAPSVLPGVEAFFDFGADREGWAPAFRVIVRHLTRSGFSSDEARAAFRLTSGVLTGCPVAWFPDARFALRPCASISYGSLEASGSNIEAPGTERHPWASVGAGLRFEFRLLRVLSLECEAGLEAALVKSRFRFGDVAFHETSPISSRFGLTLVLRTR